jgi:hypothetical protein
VKRLRSGAKRAKIDKRRNSEDEPPNDKTPPEVNYESSFDPALFHILPPCTVQPEELIRKMASIDPEKSAAHDMGTRQKIASFPPEVHDPALLAQIKGINF